MAPKGGKGGGGSSGSSSGSSGISCPRCDNQTTLGATGYNGPIELAFMAFEIINVLVLLGVLITVIRRPWLQLDGKKDNYKYRFFLVSLLSTLVYFVICIVDQGLHLAEATVNYDYVIIYIFQNLAWRISDIAIVAVILRCIQGARNSMLAGRPSKLRIIHIIAILLITIFAITGWALYVKTIASFLNYDYDDFSTAPAEVGYVAAVFAASIYMVVVVLFFVVKKAIPQTPLLFLFFVAAAYWSSGLIDLIYFTTSAYAPFSGSPGIGWASAFVGVFATMIVFIMLALLSRLSNIKTKSMFTNGSINSQSYVEKRTEHFNKSSQPSSTFHGDTSYNNGAYQNGSDWPINETNHSNNFNNNNNVSSNYQPPNMNQDYRSSPHMSQYSDPAAQPLYPSTAYNPPQQTSHVYGHSEHPQQPPPETRYYGNNAAYTSVPQTIR